MATIVSFGIQKGGSSKTTTSAITAYILSQEHKKKVLAVDLDSQGNLTEVLMGPDISIYNFEGQTVFEAMKEDNAKKCIHEVPHLKGLSMLTAEDHLAGFSAWLYQNYKGNKSTILKELLEQIEADYDYIIIDTPPALGDQTINALAASDAVVAMFEASKFCYTAIGRFITTCIYVQENVNPKLEVAGILRSLIDSRRIDNKAFIGIIEDDYGDVCFETILTRTAAIGRLGINGFSETAELKSALNPYREFVKELIERVKSK